MISGSEILAKSLSQFGVRDIFFLMGGPMIPAENYCASEGIRMIDVRHEQAAAMAANAYSRLTGGPGVCMACSGPGATNLVTGVASAFADAAPVIAIGGSSSIGQYGMNAFQEIDQVAMFRPITRWSERCYEAARIPEYVLAAFRNAMIPRPGPVYLDLPGDVLNQQVPEEAVSWTVPSHWSPRVSGDPVLVRQALDLLAVAERPVVVSGSGLIWSRAHAELQAWVEQAGIPLYTTPQGRGVVPEDHPLCMPGARGTAFREADLVLIIGTRLNYVIGFGRPPRFSADAKIIQIDIDGAEVGRTRPVDVGIVGDAGSILTALTDARDERVVPERYRAWVEHLSDVNEAHDARVRPRIDDDATPIHPLRLCREIRDFMDRDSVLCVDGQEILNYARQSIPTYVAGHRLNSGPFGTMGVGLPFGIGAKAASPDSQVIVVSGDGAFGLNAMELDTARRMRLPVLVVISNNGGWTADIAPRQGRDLGNTRYDELARSLDCFGIQVDKPDDIRPALEEANAAVQQGRPALVNVITDPMARATTTKFSTYTT